MALFNHFVPMLLVTVAVCQPPPLPPPAGRNLDCFNAYSILTRPEALRMLNIEDQQETYEYVTLSRHHIIPYATMRDFYNNLLVRDLQAFQRLFNDVIYVAAEHNALSLEMLRLTPEDYLLPNLEQLAERHLQNPDINQILLAQEVYAWLPFNIYVGPRPTDRVDDDRANAFDATAQPLVGDPRANYLRHLYQEMVRYNSDPNSNNVDTIITAMSDLVHITQLAYDFEPSQWRVVQGINEYRFTVASDAVRRNPTYRELRRDDYCNTDSQAAYDKWNKRRDRLKRATTTKCIMLSFGKDAFCINSLNTLRNFIKNGKSNPKPQLTTAGLIVHIISFGLWP